jgi:hypothetical protein
MPLNEVSVERRASVHKRQPRCKKSEIFGRLDLLPEADHLHAEVLLASWPTASPAGSVIHSSDVTVAWQQQVTRLYELGSRKVYFVRGAVKGNLQAARVIAPALLSAQFFRAFTPPRPDSTSLDCRPGDGGKPVEQSSRVRWILDDFEVVAVGVQVVSAGIAVQDQVSGYFAGLHKDNTY